MSDTENVTPEVTDEDEPTVEPVVETPDESNDWMSDPEAVKKVVKKLRDENAAARKKNATLAEDAKKWNEHEFSQKTELEQVTAKYEGLLEEAVRLKREKLQRDVLDEFGLDPDDVDLIDAPDADTMRAKAKRLAARTPAKQDPTGDLHAGNRGAPLQPDTTAGGNFLLDLADQNQF